MSLCRVWRLTLKKQCPKHLEVLWLYPSMAKVVKEIPPDMVCHLHLFSEDYDVVNSSYIFRPTCNVVRSPVLTG